MYRGFVTQNIEGEVYKKLIDYILKTCDTMKVTFPQAQKRDLVFWKEVMQKKEELEKNFSHLFRTSRKRESENFYHKYYYVYLDITLRKYLLSNGDLFSWKIPEDLTFFRDNYCFLRCSSHNAICCILCDSLEEFEVLKKLGIQFSGNFCEVDKEEYQINKMRC